MRFSQFCDIAENTEKEQQLLQFLKQDDMKPVKKAFGQLARKPFIGKLFTAVIALSDYESIAAFKQSEHYEHIKDWNFNIDFDKNSLLIGPNEEQAKKALKVLAVGGAAITLIIMCRKLCCRRK